MPVSNQQITEHAFLRSLYRDDYYPDHVVDLGKAILLRLCERVETEHPADLPALYALTEAATEDFWFVANAYGFADADVEELIAVRDW
ncbi:DUF5713 family protein [Streptomyces sp. NPDC048504]|uniref:DUF5713 family protein n=1 Tax=Streptomyces sp. NPDC048504 TaxID=3365559 RepID=UPI003719A292